jgi:hypothetical protein
MARGAIRAHGLAMLDGARRDSSARPAMLDDARRDSGARPVMLDGSRFDQRPDRGAIFRLRPGAAFSYGRALPTYCPPERRAACGMT